MTQTAHAITLCGSVETVVEYLGFSINNILYQRGVYPVDTFQQVRKYGMSLMVSTNEALNAYIANLLQQVANWVANNQCRLFAILIIDPRTEATLERWEITVEVEGRVDGGGLVRPRHRKSEEDVRRELQAVLRQITASVSFLPLLSVPCAFDVVVYTSPDADVPSDAWEMSNPRRVAKGAEVPLKSFSTGYHRVGTAVTFQE